MTRQHPYALVTDADKGTVAVLPHEARSAPPCLRARP